MQFRTVGIIVTIALSLLWVPLTAEAQQAEKVWRISFLALLPGEDKTLLMQALVERLHALGYSEGKNMTFTYHSAEGHPEQLPQLAMEIVQAKPDVLIAGFGTLTAQAAKAATTTIPIVFASLGDPIGAGLVASLGQPGGNVTGFSSQATYLQEKRLQLLQEILPGKAIIAVLRNPDTPYTSLALKELTTAAEAGQTRLEVLEARTAVRRQVVVTRVAGVVVDSDAVRSCERERRARSRDKAPTVAVAVELERGLEHGGLDQHLLGPLVQLVEHVHDLLDVLVQHTTQIGQPLVVHWCERNLGDAQGISGL
jgi:putative ABC transport system substrate-binding protein